MGEAAQSGQRYIGEKPTMVYGEPTTLLDERESIPSLVARIRQADDRASAMRQEVGRIADNIYGTQPEPGTSTGNVPLPPAGSLQEGHRALDSLERELSQLSGQIDRLAKL